MFWLGATRNKLNSLDDVVKGLQKEVKDMSITRTKLNSLEDDLRQLKKDVKNLTAKVDADLLARYLLQWLGKGQDKSE
jgi:archaellum component FlaC